jgi:hypothetical protein
VLVVRIVAPLESAALTSQLASTAVSSPSSLAIVLESWVGQVMGGNGPAKNAHVYHRERLRLLANPKRLKASGMATVRGMYSLVGSRAVALMIFCVGVGGKTYVHIGWWPIRSAAFANSSILTHVCVYHLNT